jgi:long-chain acyl-CoA synthetase
VNIYPAEIDAVLLMHPDVADAAAVGVPNEEFGEEVKAVVVPAPGKPPSPELAQALIAFCREHLAHFKCPRSVDFASDLPRSDAGKVYRRLVREPYWKGWAWA